MVGQFARDMINKCRVSLARCSKTVNFQLFWFSQTGLCQPLTDIFTLISLKLKNLTILGVFYNSAVTSKFLKEKITKPLSYELIRVIHIPSCNGEQFFSNRIRQTVLEQWLKFYDHYAAEYECELDHPVLPLPDPYRRQRRDLQSTVNGNLLVISQHVKSQQTRQPYCQVTIAMEANSNTSNP